MGQLNGKYINNYILLSLILTLTVLFSLFADYRVSANYSYSGNYSDAGQATTYLSVDRQSCSHTNSGYVDDLYKLISTSPSSNVSYITSPGYESGDSKYIYTGVNCSYVSYYVDYQYFSRYESGYSVPYSVYINNDNGYYGYIYQNTVTPTTDYFYNYGDSGGTYTYYTCGYYDNYGNCAYSYAGQTYGNSPPSSVILGYDRNNNPVYGYPNVTYQPTQYYYYNGNVISYSYQNWSYPQITQTKTWYDAYYYGRLSKSVSYWTNEPHYVSQVRVDYIKNETPQIVSLTELSYDKYSEKSGHNTINISGKVTDRNINDTLTVKYQIDGKVGTLATVSNPGKTDVNFNGSIVVDSQVLETSGSTGNTYTKKPIHIWVEDKKKSSYAYTNNTGVSGYTRYYHGASDIKSDLKTNIDKVHPFLDSTTLTPSEWTTGSVQVDTDVKDFSGVGNYKEVHQVINTSKNMPICFTTVDDLNNSGKRCHDVGNIDTVAPDYSINRSTGSSFLKNHNATVTIVRDGKSPTYTENGTTLVSDSATRNGSGVEKIYYAYTPSNVFPSSGFTELPMTGTTADYKVHRVDPPVGLTGTYYLHVGVVDKLGNKKEQTYPTTFNLDNTPPSGVSLNVNAASDKSITVQGSALDDYAGLHSTPYMYYVDDVAKTSFVNTSRQTISGLSPNTLYTVKFKSRDVLGTESNIYDNLAQRVRTHASLPSLNLTALSKDSIDLVINNNGNPSDTEYYVERSTTSNFALGTVTNLVNWKAVSSYTDSGLVGNTIYYYRIKARAQMVDGTYVETAWSNSNVYTLAEGPGVSFTDVTANSLSLLIDPKSNSASTLYEIHRSTSRDSGYSVVRSYSTSLTFTNTGLSNGVVYYYKVRAKNSVNAVSDFSEVIYKVTVPAAPNISSVKASDSLDEGKSLIINWTPVAGSEQYEIFNVTDNSIVSIVDSSLGTYEVQNLLPNKGYVFKLKSINSSGSSSYGSNSSRVYTRANDVLGGTLTSISSNSSTWLLNPDSKNVDSAQYKIEFREKGKNVAANTPVDNFSTSLTRTGYGLKPGIEYEVWAYTRNNDSVVNPGVKISDSFFLNRPPEFSEVKLNKDKLSEVSGFNNLNVSGKVRDKDFEVSADIYKLYYTIYNKLDNKVVTGFNNIFIKEYRALNNAAWDSLNIDIPIDSKLAEGRYQIKLTAIDTRNEKDEVTLDFLIDKTGPSGNLLLKNSSTDSSIKYGLYSVEADIAGLKDNPFNIYKKVNQGSYNILLNGVNNYDYTDSDLESNTLYSYKIQIEDSVGHVFETNEINYLTGISLIEKDIYYDKDVPSSLIIEWENALEKSDEVQIEIYRNGSLVAIVDEGSKYIDSELDYERDYPYEFIVVSKDSNGDRIESVKTEVVYRTGSPILIVTGPEKVYKTLFSNFARAAYRAEFKQGGTLKVDFEDLRGNLSNDYALSPNIKNDINIDFEVKKGQVIPLLFTLNKNNIKMTITKELLVEEVAPVIRNVSPQQYVEKYKK